MAQGMQITDTLIFEMKINEGAGGKPAPKVKQEVDALATSIIGLAQQNKKLREERNKLDTTDKAAQQRIQEINKLLDENNSKIKENSSALEKQRLNIGNYTSALDKVIPGLGGVVDGFKSAGKAAMAFLANPIVAGIALIVGALAGLVAGYSKSAQGARDLETATNALKGTFQQITNDIGSFVEKIIGAGGVTKALGNLLSVINPVIGHYYALSVAIEKNTQAFEQNKAAAEGAGKFYLQLAEVNKRIAEDDNESAERRINAANRVIVLIEAGAKKRKEVLENRIRELGRIDEKSQETIDEIANLRKELDDLAEETTGRISPILELINAIKAQYEAEAEALSNEARERRIAELDRQIEEERTAYAARLEFIKTFNMNVEADTMKSIDRIVKYREKEEIDKLKKKKKEQTEYETQLEKFKADSIALINEGLFEKRRTLAVLMNTIFKATAIQETVSNTYAAAVAAYKSAANIPYVGFILGPLAAAAAVGFGLLQVGKLQGINFKFARGGRADKEGTFYGPSHAGGGVNYIREDGKHAINVEGGENFYILNKNASKRINSLSRLNQETGGVSWTPSGTYPGMRSSFALGGEVATARIARESDNSSIERTVRSVMANMTPIYVVAQDVSEVQGASNDIARRAQVI